MAKIDRRKAYYADAVIRLQALFNLEVLLLETSGHYNNKDERKISFDNIKDLFALLSIIKAVADVFDHGSQELFQKIKSHFIMLAVNVYIRLWFIQYASSGIYIFNREDKIEISEDKDNMQEALPSLMNFFYHVKISLLQQTSDLLYQLKSKHDENKKAAAYENSNGQALLSDIICPKVFRLTYNKHGRGFARQSFKSSATETE